MNVIPAPNGFKKVVKVWVDEAIWGHRFYNDQSPWLVFLEFLCVFRARHRAGYALDEPLPGGTHEVRYHIPRLLPLRELVFNNPHIQRIEATRRSDNEKWLEWLSCVNINGSDYSFLRHRFEKFSSLTHVVEYFRNTAIEPNRDRRWTSRFIFPHGPDCLFADLPKNPYKSPDRRFFARGGELLYLMLCRSGHGREIAELINKKLLRTQDPWNRVAKALLPQDCGSDTKEVSSAIGYLPYMEREEYEALAETWKQLLQLQLPGAVLFDPLVRLSALHMLLYILRRAAEEIGGDNKEPRFVLEIAAPGKTVLYELSSESLRANRVSTLRAVRAHVESARDDEGWHRALNARVPADAVRDFLTDRFAWEPEDNDFTGGPNKIFSKLHSYAEKRHKQHVDKVHNEWTKQIGLTFSQRAVGTWYAPSDSLLKALVMCIVEDGREEYHRFLAKLYERFRIVIAAPEAERAFSSLPTDQHEFTLNAQRLEQRLRTLGLLRRLSDDCAYVLNPFRRRA